MAVQQINPTFRTVGSKGRTGGGAVGAGLMGTIGGIVGGAAGGGLTGGWGTAAGATAGAAAGAGLGQMLGEAVLPSRAGGSQSMPSPTVATAFDTAQQSQQLLDGLRAIQSHSSLSEYVEPMTQAYTQSLVRLKKYG
jgi:hypothetical protein